jgi:hypothetical protein
MSIIFTTVYSLIAGAQEAQTNLPEKNYCKDYTIGEERIISDDFLSGLIGFNTVSYGVKKVSELHYQLTFNLRISGSDPMGFHQRIGQCYDWFNDTYSNAQGIRIEFLLAGYHASAINRVRPIKINVIPKEQVHRDNSRNYSEETRCSTIIHEALHLTGLPDEYQEEQLKTSTGKYKYDCRSRSNSIMADSPMYQFSKTIGNKLLICGCRPDKNFLQCDKSVSELNRNPDLFIGECPETSALVREFDITQNSNNWSKATEFARSISVSGSAGGSGFSTAYVFNSGKEFRFRPLLNGHLNKIIFHGCSPKNKIFDECAQNAYRTSVANGGEGCIETSPICRTFGEWLE